MAASNDNQLVYRNISRHKPHSAGEAFFYTLLMILLASLIGGGFYGLIHGYKNGWDYMAFFGGIGGGVFLIWRLIVFDRSTQIHGKEEEYEPARPAADEPERGRVWQRKEEAKGFEVSPQLPAAYGAQLASAVWAKQITTISARSLKDAGIIPDRNNKKVVASIVDPMAKLGWLDNKNQVNGDGFFGLFNLLPRPEQERYYSQFSKGAAATPPPAATSRGGEYTGRPPRTLGQE